MTTAVSRGARYAAMFSALRERGEGAFIPFTVVGDPDPVRSLATIRVLVSSGADALELGLPFSDPVADGPVIQAAVARALEHGVRKTDCWSLLARLRGEFPELPIGLLVYTNLVLHNGDPGRFYADAAHAGVDSVLLADLPVVESDVCASAARAHGIAPVFIAPPNSDDARLAAIAAAGEGYTYVTSRAGVTGADRNICRDQGRLIARLAELAAPPPVLGFGISTPDHVRAALAMGASGVISGSAVVKRIAEGGDLAKFVSEMKDATRGSPAAGPRGPLRA